MSEKHTHQLVASARRSGPEDVQRGTPPVLLASRSLSPFFRACIITVSSTADHETDSTGTSILIPLQLLNFNMRLYGNRTAWCLFFMATAPPKFLTRIRNRLNNQTKTKTKSQATTKKFHTPTLFYLSMHDSTAIYGVISRSNHAQKNKSFEETLTCVLPRGNLPNRPKQ